MPPLLTQWNVHRAQPALRGAILLYQVGEFYECFYGDASALAATCKVVLTSRGKVQGQVVPMAGVPLLSLPATLAELQSNGILAAVFRQQATPAQAGPGVLPRAMELLATPATWFPAGADLGQARWLVAIAAAAQESHAASSGDACTLACVWMDCTSGAVLASTAPEHQLLDCLVAMPPAHLVVHPSAAHAVHSVLDVRQVPLPLIPSARSAAAAAAERPTAGISHSAPRLVPAALQGSKGAGDPWQDVCITPWAAGRGELAASSAWAEQVCSEEPLLRALLPALQTAAQFVTWASGVDLGSFHAPQLINSVPRQAVLACSEHSAAHPSPTTSRAATALHLPAWTRRALEIQRASDGRYKASSTLLAAVDHTVTPAGARLLSMRLAQPSVVAAVIAARHAATAEALAWGPSIPTLRSVLRQAGDVERHVRAAADARSSARPGARAGLYNALLALHAGGEACASLSELLQSVAPAQWQLPSLARDAAAAASASFDAGQHTSAGILPAVRGTLQLWSHAKDARVAGAAPVDAVVQAMQPEADTDSDVRHAAGQAIALIQEQPAGSLAALQLAAGLLDAAFGWAATAEEPAHVQACNALMPLYRDVASAMTDTPQAVSAAQQQARADCGIPNARLRCTRKHGYTLEVPIAAAQALAAEPGWEWIMTLKSSARFKHAQLYSLDRRVQQAEALQSAIEEAVVGVLQAAVKQALPLLHAAGTAVAVLDVVLSSAWAVQQHGLCIPRVDESHASGAALAVLGVRHLPVEQALEQAVASPAAGGAARNARPGWWAGPYADVAGESEALPARLGPAAYTANDVVIPCGACMPGEGTCCVDAPPEARDGARLLLTTGGNMSGKSCLLRSVAHAVVCAQAGLPVAASSYTGGVVDAVFARVGAGDDVSRGQSTFYVESAEVAVAMQQATKHSLIIVDEMGRGTEPADGEALAQAAAEALRDDVACLTLFATHFTGLARRMQAQPGVRAVRMGCHVLPDGRPLFTHKLERGVAPTAWALHAATEAGMPVAVLDRAAVLLAAAEQSGRA